MKRLGLRHSATILASLMMSGLMPMGSGPEPTPEPTPEPRRIPPPAPYFPPKRELPSLTPEQIKAAEKRARKARRLAAKETP